MKIKIDNVIWQFAKLYRKKFVEDHPGRKLNMSVAAVATFCALRDNGNAEECTNADGSVTFLSQTGLETGPLVTLGPGVH
jgi:hypothetical protein